MSFGYKRGEVTSVNFSAWPVLVLVMFSLPTEHNTASEPCVSVAPRIFTFDPNKVPTQSITLCVLIIGKKSCLILIQLGCIQSYGHVSHVMHPLRSKRAEIIRMVVFCQWLSINLECTTDTEAVEGRRRFEP
jgi:hypothetical protein